MKGEHTYEVRKQKETALETCLRSRLCAAEVEGTLKGRVAQAEEGPLALQAPDQISFDCREALKRNREK